MVLHMGRGRALLHVDQCNVSIGTKEILEKMKRHSGLE